MEIVQICVQIKIRSFVNGLKAFERFVVFDSIWIYFLQEAHYAYKMTPHVCKLYKEGGFKILKMTDYWF